MSDGTTAFPNRTVALAESISIMTRLRAPDGCPWDREQTFDSIKRHTLEETYEVFDAIDRRAWSDLRDELGDLLLQVLFYAQMAEEGGHFSIEDVAANLNAKLIRRHPHIFAGGVARSSADVKANWNAIKQMEKTQDILKSEDFLKSVPNYTPALVEATKLGERAAEVGFDWPSSTQLLLKLDEEVRELSEEIKHPSSGVDAVEDELGDVLFTVVNLARHLKLVPEFALRRANRKFRNRFTNMLSAIGGIDELQSATPAELDDLWRAAKQTLNASGEEAQAAYESHPDTSLSPQE